MKILLVSYSHYPQTIGGVENSIRHIASELYQKGHDVKIFCILRDQNQPSRIIFEGIEIIRCKLERARRFPVIGYLPRLPIIGYGRLHGGGVVLLVKQVSEGIKPVLHQFLPDVIWCRSTNMGLAIVRSGYNGKLFNIFPTTAYMDCRGLYLNTTGLSVGRKLLKLALYPSAYRMAKHIERELISSCYPICFSKNMYGQLLKTYGKIAGKTRIIYPGVDINRFSAAVGQQQFTKIQKKYGLQENERFVVCVGRLSVAKNVPILIDALRYLKLYSRLVIVGDGQEKAYLQNYASRHGVSERVLFVGNQNELLPGFYTMAKVCVVPTTIESFGQIYLESMACGTPVVGFAADGRKVLTATDEIVQDGRTGRVVQKVSPQALAAGINSILDMSDSRYQTMSNNAVEDTKQRFSWRRFVEQMLLYSNE